MSTDGLRKRSSLCPDRGDRFNDKLTVKAGMTKYNNIEKVIASSDVPSFQHAGECKYSKAYIPLHEPLHIGADMLVSKRSKQSLVARCQAWQAQCESQCEPMENSLHWVRKGWAGLGSCWLHFIGVLNQFDPKLSRVYQAYMSMRFISHKPLGFKDFHILICSSIVPDIKFRVDLVNSMNNNSYLSQEVPQHGVAG